MQEDNRCLIRNITFRLILAYFISSLTLGKQDFVQFSNDLTIISTIKFADGLHRLGIGFIDTLKDELSINHINTQKNYDFTDVNEQVQKIIKNPDKSPGKVAILISSYGSLPTLITLI